MMASGSSSARFILIAVVMSALAIQWQSSFTMAWCPSVGDRCGLLDHCCDKDAAGNWLTCPVFGLYCEILCKAGTRPCPGLYPGLIGCCPGDLLAVEAGAHTNLATTTTDSS
ncbi:hypothetical protein CBR_g48140 [Chara braunii]|uniref:Granulins domain-containing protein n=1 Tax=Chara braunii TaxID=69332 RepID=A0A388M206_CHABU|nr:hypothetical protein CBR_g48140 [Chara braunii]|eukprot:GBG88610.1 hypothetical protein CBR_g48140 [Chara braunii]